MKALELKPAATEKMSPEKFLELFQHSAQRSNIKDVIIVPPRLGSESFGEIEVEFKSPVYEVDFDA